jgi:hypothetical protein
LDEALDDHSFQDLAYINPFLHSETEQENLVFQHFAYVMPKQLQFKETYYGYPEAKRKWMQLQQQNTLPIFLKNYFDWVSDDTIVNSIQSCGIVPIMTFNASGDWEFNYLSEEFDYSRQHYFRQKDILEQSSSRTVEMHQLEALVATIQSMESSKLWKLRSLLLKLQRKKDIEVSEYLTNTLGDSVEEKIKRLQKLLLQMKSSKFWKLREQWFNLKQFLNDRFFPRFFP